MASQDFVNIALSNGFSSVRRHIVTCTDDNLFSRTHLKTIFSEFSIKIERYSLKHMRLQVQIKIQHLLNLINTMCVFSGRSMP